MKKGRYHLLLAERDGEEVFSIEIVRRKLIVKGDVEEALRMMEEDFIKVNLRGLVSVLEEQK